MEHLKEIQDHYQQQFDSLLDQRDRLLENGITDVYLIEERLKALCSGLIALNKVRQLKNIDGNENKYHSPVVYKKERDQIFKSQLV